MSSKSQIHLLTFGLGLSYFDILSISSKATMPIPFKFHIKHPGAEETKQNCSKGPGHITNMAAMLVHGYNLLKSSSPKSMDRSMALIVDM